MPREVIQFPAVNGTISTETSVRWTREEQGGHVQLCVTRYPHPRRCINGCNGVTTGCSDCPPDLLQGVPGPTGTPLPDSLLGEVAQDGQVQKGWIRAHGGHVGDGPAPVPIARAFVTDEDNRVSPRKVFATTNRSAEDIAVEVAEEVTKLKRALSRLSPLEGDGSAYNAMFADLVALEEYRRALLVDPTRAVLVDPTAVIGSVSPFDGQPVKPEGGITVEGPVRTSLGDDSWQYDGPDQLDTETAFEVDGVTHVKAKPAASKLQSEPSGWTDPDPSDKDASFTMLRHAVSDLREAPAYTSSEEFLKSATFGATARTALAGAYLLPPGDNAELAATEPDGSVVMWSDPLDRTAINKLIKVLRRARDQAYGRDE